MWQARTRNKYRARKQTYKGETFDSLHELERYKELELMAKAGLIKNLSRQVRFELIPAQYEPDIVTKTGKAKRGKLIERKCEYIADFVYFDNEKCEPVVEDTKGYRTKDYIIKRKLMLYMNGIRVKEV